MFYDINGLEVSYHVTIFLNYNTYSYDIKWEYKKGIESEKCNLKLFGAVATVMIYMSWNMRVFLLFLHINMYKKLYRKQLNLTQKAILCECWRNVCKLRYLIKLSILWRKNRESPRWNNKLSSCSKSVQNICTRLFALFSCYLKRILVMRLDE